MFDLTRRRLLTKTSVAVKSGKRYEAVHQSLTAPGYSRRSSPSSLSYTVL